MYYEKVKEWDDADFWNFLLLKITLVKKWWKLRFLMKNNKICGKLQKGANFAAANLPLGQQKTTMTAIGLAWNIVCR